MWLNICECDSAFVNVTWHLQLHLYYVTLHLDMLCLIYICTHWGNSCSADSWSNNVDKPWRSTHDVHPSCNKEVVLEVVLPLPYMAHLRKWHLAKKAWELSLVAWISTTLYFPQTKFLAEWGFPHSICDSTCSLSARCSSSSSANRYWHVITMVNMIRKLFGIRYSRAGHDAVL